MLSKCHQAQQMPSGLPTYSSFVPSYGSDPCRDTLFSSNIYWRAFLELCLHVKNGRRSDHRSGILNFHAPDSNLEHPILSVEFFFFLITLCSWIKTRKPISVSTLLALRSALVSWPDTSISVSGASKFLESSFGFRNKLFLNHHFKQFKDVLIGPRALGIRPLLFLFFSFGVRLTFWIKFWLGLVWLGQLSWDHNTQPKSIQNVSLSQKAKWSFIGVVSYRPYIASSCRGDVQAIEDNLKFSVMNCWLLPRGRLCAMSACSSGSV